MLPPPPAVSPPAVAGPAAGGGRGQSRAEMIVTEVGKLKKIQLVKMLKQKGLDATGSLDDCKTRLAKALLADLGPAQMGGPSAPTPSSAAVPLAPPALAIGGSSGGSWVASSTAPPPTAADAHPSASTAVGPTVTRKAASPATLTKALAASARDAGRLQKVPT